MLKEKQILNIKYGLFMNYRELCFVIWR